MNHIEELYRSYLHAWSNHVKLWHELNRAHDELEKLTARVKGAYQKEQELWRAFSLQYPKLTELIENFPKEEDGLFGKASPAELFLLAALRQAEQAADTNFAAWKRTIEEECFSV